MKYIILEAASPQQLTMLVNQFIASGWKPQGGVSDGSLYCQAMIKE